MRMSRKRVRRGGWMKVAGMDERSVPDEPPEELPDGSDGAWDGEPDGSSEPERSRRPRRVLRRLVMLCVVGWLLWDTNAGRRLVHRVRQAAAWVYEIASTGELEGLSRRMENFRSLLADVLRRAQEAADQGIEVAPLEDVVREVARGVDVQALKRAALSAVSRIGASLEAARPGGPVGSPVEGRVSSGFGYRVHPVTGEWAFHEGVDIPVRSGTEVRATADGVVVSSDFHGTLGRAVILNHGNGWQTRYGHLDELRVFEGARVRKGQVIGVVGRTGRVTGVHVHYETRYNGIPVKPRL
jgi:murein DD-endopeptidase MepM/ murein hydrolase activator NlpD